MKKLFLALLFPTVLLAQEPVLEVQEVVPQDSIKTSKITISVYGILSEPSHAGLSIEREIKSARLDGGLYSFLINGGAGFMSYNNTRIGDISGNGFVIEVGARMYHEKNGRKTGLFAENLLAYGSIEFDKNNTSDPYDPNVTNNPFKGTYSYVSVFNPNAGYKFIRSKSFVFEASIGANWKWELDAKGEVDNADFFNVLFRVGAKVGYRF